MCRRSGKLRARLDSVRRRLIHSSHRLLAIVLALAWMPAAGARCVEHASAHKGCCPEGAVAAANKVNAADPVARNCANHPNSGRAHTCCSTQIGCYEAPATEPFQATSAVALPVVVLPTAALDLSAHLVAATVSPSPHGPPLYLRNETLLI